MRTQITRRGDRGLGKTAAGGNNGSFAGHERSAAAPPTPISPILELSDQQVVALEDGADRVDGVEQVLQDRLDAGLIDTSDVSYDVPESFRGADIDRYLAGETDDLIFEIEDASEDDVAARAENLARDFLEEQGVDPDAVSDTVIESLATRIRDDADTEADLVEQVAKGTPAQLLRAPLSHEEFAWSSARQEWFTTNPAGYTGAELRDGHEDRCTEARTQFITDYLARAGIRIDSEHDREAIRDLVVEGPYNWDEGVRLDAIWYGRITDAGVGDDGEKTIRLGGAPHGTSENQAGRTHIVLLDTYSGSGYEVGLDTPITVTLDADRPAMLDSGGSAGGYGWDDSAGAYKPAFSVNVEETSTRKFRGEGAYEREPGTLRLTDRGRAEALADLEAELSKVRRELHLRQTKFHRHDLTDAEMDEWNALHDRHRELEHEQAEAIMNVKRTITSTAERLAFDNVD